MAHPVADSLVGKSARERATLKSQAIAGLVVRPGRYVSQDYGVQIQIVALKAIEGGVEVYAQAYQSGAGGKQIGLGSDKQTDVERFRVWNPPILVDDISGDIVQSWTDPEGVAHERRLREDPVAALIDTIAHAVTITGDPRAKINTGSIGNTTATFYPDANPETNSVDGYATRSTTDDTFANIRNGAGTTASDSDSSASCVLLRTYLTTDKYRQITRSIFGFDTSGIGSGATVSSATFSAYVTALSSDYFTQSLVLDRKVPASATALATGDYLYSGWDAAEQATARIAQTALTTSAYNDFTLNATGLGNLNLTGVSWYGLRYSSDFDGVAPTWASNSQEYATINYADASGTSTDPKLVVVYTAAQTVSPVHVASAESFSTPTVTPGAVNVAPSTISTDESVAMPTVVPGAVSVVPNAIPSGESLPDPTVVPGAVAVAPAAIGSSEAVETPTIAAVADVLPDAVATSESVPNPMVSPGAVTVGPAVIPTAEQMHAPTAVPGAVAVAPGAVPSAEFVASPTVQPGAVAVGPDAISTAESVPSPSVGLAVAPDAIGSSEAVESPTVAPGGVAVTPDHVPSDETLYDPTVTRGLTVVADPVSSTESVFGPTVSPGTATVTPDTVASGETLYAPAVAMAVIAGGVATAEAFYEATVQRGAVTISPDAIVSGEAFGSPSILIAVPVDAIGTGEAVYAPGIAVSAPAIVPDGIASDEAVYAPSVSLLLIVLQPDAIPSAESVNDVAVGRRYTGAAPRIYDLRGQIDRGIEVRDETGAIARSYAFAWSEIPLAMDETGGAARQHAGRRTVIAAMAYFPRGVDLVADDRIVVEAGTFRVLWVADQSHHLEAALELV